MPARIPCYDRTTGEAVMMWAIDAHDAAARFPEQWSLEPVQKPAPAASQNEVPFLPPGTPMSVPTMHAPPAVAKPAPKPPRAPQKTWRGKPLKVPPGPPAKPAPPPEPPKD